jgi:CRISPR-associated protein Cmr5
MQTLQQQRAKHALAQVKDLAMLSGEGDKLKSRAAELPFMIHANGLGQAAAFFKSKKEKDGYDKLYIVLNSWLTQEGRPYYRESDVATEQRDLMQAIVESDMATYRVAQAEAMHYMDWVKKFAKAYL